jgi:glycerol kinase
VPDSGGLVLVPAFAGLGAPYWDPGARGLAIGLTRGVNRAHFCRAALESIAFQSGELLACMARDSECPAQVLRVDGGATRNDLLMQIQADLTGVPVKRPPNVESTALGAAGLAGLAVGMWDSAEEIVAARGADTVFTPQGDPADVERRWQAWHRAVERARGWE